MDEYQNVEQPFLEERCQLSWQVIDQGFEICYESIFINSTQAPEISTQASEISTQLPEISTQALKGIQDQLQVEISALGVKEHDQEKVRKITRKICSSPMKAEEIAKLLGRREDYIRRKFLKPMIKEKELSYLYPEMIHHPEQAYHVKQ
ncbi:MAG: hypothetical protein H0X62_05505 [Bacteroidetes bacterium]|nr:hypothetical protein [Bacteroidota bacterium]